MGPRHRPASVSTPLMPTSPPGAPDRQSHSSSLQETVSLSHMHMDNIFVDYLVVGHCAERCQPFFPFPDRIVGTTYVQLGKKKKKWARGAV